MRIKEGGAMKIIKLFFVLIPLLIASCTGERARVNSVVSAVSSQ